MPFSRDFRGEYCLFQLVSVRAIGNALQDGARRYTLVLLRAFTRVSPAALGLLGHYL